MYHTEGFRLVDKDVFRSHLADSSLVKSPASDLTKLCDQYDSVLTTILDRHAPLRSRLISQRPKAPWYTDDIKENKTKRRNLERRWRCSRLTVDWQIYVTQCNKVKNMIFEAKMNYYSNLISDAGSDSNALFRTIDRLLHRSPEKQLPSSPSPKVLANSFIQFFKDKIINIQNNLPSLISERTNCFSMLDHLTRPNCSLESFKPTTCDELLLISKKLSSKSCSLDPIPSSLLKDHYGILLPVICNIINLSLENGYVPPSLKVAVLKPLLKKSSLNHEVLANYRPISNLKVVSKMIEKIVAVQLNTYLSENDLHEPFQSAYKCLHSCETALLRVQNDILHAIDNRNCVVLLLLDLSAAFDTVDHGILLNRLHSKFGIRGNVLKWFKSYLSDRSQYVALDGGSSDCAKLDCGVPQGSVLGPILYLLYTSPVADILRNHNMSFHLYADDTQLYIPFTCNDDVAMNHTMTMIENCLSDIDEWMTTNKLKLNKDKTEFLLLFSKHNPNKCLPTLNFGNDQIKPSESARNIGVIFDSTLSMVPQINSVCKSAFYHLRNIARIRKYLSAKTAETLIHAFVTSKIDQYNCLLYGLPTHLISKLQSVQNAAARLITYTHKYDHISPVLIKLHWLPVAERIKFKILLITYKSLYDLAPSYISEMISRYHPPRCLRSSSSLLLEHKKYQLRSYGYRSFSVSSPELWNALPPSVRNSDSLSSFKTSLKTYLFKIAFNL